MAYTLNLKETGNKAAKFHYTVTDDQTGTIISERRSNRRYVAAAINGMYYFGRFDLIGRGDHGKHIKACEDAGKEPIAIACLDIKQMTDEQKSEAETYSEKNFYRSHPELNP